MTTSPCASSRGITLIEVLVVVALLGIVAALVAPSFQGMLARQRVQGINAELVGDIQFVRSQVIARNDRVRITFGSNANMTCYTIHTSAVTGTCRCTETPGRACLKPDGSAWEGVNEIKTVQIRRETSVTVSPSPLPRILFDVPDGRPNRSDFRVDVASSRGGTMRTSVGTTGRPVACSPDGSITGAPACP